MHFCSIVGTSVTIWVVMETWDLVWYTSPKQCISKGNWWLYRCFSTETGWAASHVVVGILCLLWIPPELVNINKTTRLGLLSKGCRSLLWRLCTLSHDQLNNNRLLRVVLSTVSLWNGQCRLHSLLCCAYHTVWMHGCWPRPCTIAVFVSCYYQHMVYIEQCLHATPHSHAEMQTT